MDSDWLSFFFFLSFWRLFRRYCCYVDIVWTSVLCSTLVDIFLIGPIVLYLNVALYFFNKAKYLEHVIFLATLFLWQSDEPVSDTPYCFFHHLRASSKSYTVWRFVHPGSLKSKNVPLRAKLLHECFRHQCRTHSPIQSPLSSSRMSSSSSPRKASIQVRLTERAPNVPSEAPGKGQLHYSWSMGIYAVSFQQQKIYWN